MGAGVEGRVGVHIEWDRERSGLGPGEPRGAEGRASHRAVEDTGYPLRTDQAVPAPLHLHTHSLIQCF